MIISKELMLILRNFLRPVSFVTLGHARMPLSIQETLVQLVCTLHHQQQRLLERTLFICEANTYLWVVGNPGSNQEVHKLLLCSEALDKLQKWSWKIWVRKVQVDSHICFQTMSTLLCVKPHILLVCFWNGNVGKVFSLPLFSREISWSVCIRVCLIQWHWKKPSMVESIYGFIRGYMV